ncbi:teratocarcinoma-derived growth factor 1 isoform X1 [Tupaia chinensis]|uniref:teratocarcinoma-derived growth factor 1 isoform X1 n=1 Tax=Tupaia chinensis TaxID=246437 RepID=UPI0003C8E7A6|nr:teratocarcinoma-derived growth factor 1 isoform X1 [Tupaia chinensis]
MGRFAPSVILILAISVAFQLGSGAAGPGHREPARPPRGDLAGREDSARSREEPAIRPRSSQFVPSVGIQDSKELNRTCCLNGGTCVLGSFCACPPSFYGRNCEHNAHRENCGPVPHDTWLPRTCSLCKCWRGHLRCFRQTFLPGCGLQDHQVQGLLVVLTLIGVRNGKCPSLEGSERTGHKAGPHRAGMCLHVHPGSAQDGSRMAA